MDREKVIKGLKDIIDFFEVMSVIEARCNELKQEAEDALALLKEQEAVKPKSKVRHGANAQIQHFCGRCNAMLHGKPKFCSECGRPVNWNE